VDVFVCFDNEEVGSLTRQGANSDFLKNTLERILVALGQKDRFGEVIARSFLVSADNAHANHPNYPEISDPTTKVALGGGIVIKYNANQKYTSDALSASVVKEVAKAAGVPVQEYTNRSDLRGGSTLGNLSNAEVSLACCDIGLPQLAMHSSYELLGKEDIEAMVLFMKAYFEKEVEIAGQNAEIR
jgi:aspartyl aminopeptidase